MIRRTLLFLPFALFLLAGCARSPERQVVLTQHQRDSIISRSVLPGAAVVGRAMELDGKAAAHSAAFDSLVTP